MEKFVLLQGQHQAAVISKVRFLSRHLGGREVQLRLLHWTGTISFKPILSLRDLKSTEFTEADIERIKSP